MKQYKQLLQDILDKGVWKEARQGVRCLSLFGYPIKFDLGDGFPLLTMKKMPFKTVTKEWLYLIQGGTSAYDLMKQNVNVWNKDAYSKYKNSMKNDLESNKEKHYSEEEFIEKFKIDEEFGKYWGNRIAPYGHNFRNWVIDPISHGTGIDQVQNIIQAIKDNPYDRRHIIGGWDASTVYDFYLPQCHSVLTQFNCRRPNTVFDRLSDEKKEKYKHKFYLDMFTYQRSCDTPLGVPFNICQAGLLLTTFAYFTNMIPGEVTYVFGDVHIYENQIENVKEFLKRDPLPLPTVIIKGDYKNIDDLTPDSFELLEYQSYDKFSFELTT